MMSVRASGGRPPAGESTHVVLSAAPVGPVIAGQLQADGHRVTLVDESRDSSGIPGVVGDPADAGVLAESGVGTAATVVVTTRSDTRTLLIAQLVRARFDVPRVITLVNDPDRVPVFEAAGHEAFCVTTALSTAFAEAV